MALISLKHVSKVYPKGTRPALDDINLDIDRGDFVFLVGASGSGKTTLLSLLLREEEATGGEIRVAGNDLRRISNRQVPQYRRSIGFVFQDYKLLNNKTVWQNVAFALEVIGTRRSAIKSLVPKVLETVGLTGKENNYPHELSGGEQQRVAIARAYVNHPQILLADEPTGNLDPTTSLGIMEVLDAINRTGTTVVMATHNEEIVNSMRKRVVELHTGRIVRDEEHGSYDSAVYFPDAEVTSRAHQALGGGSHAASDAARRVPGREAGDERFRPHGAVEAEVTQAIAIEAGAVAAGAMNGDEGIARLAQSVHSGRTGRYGEAFAPLETTLTWGKGLQLDEMERLAKAKEEAEQAKDGSAGSDGSDGSAGSADGTEASVSADASGSVVDSVSADASGLTDASGSTETSDATDSSDASVRSDTADADVPPAPPVASDDAADEPTDDTSGEPVDVRSDDSDASDIESRTESPAESQSESRSVSDDAADIPAVAIPEVIAGANRTADKVTNKVADADDSVGPDADGSDGSDADDDLLAPPAPPTAAPDAHAGDETGHAENTGHAEHTGYTGHTENEEDEQ